MRNEPRPRVVTMLSLVGVGTILSLAQGVAFLWLALGVVASFMMSGGPSRLLPEVECRSASPDGLREVVVTTRVAFPPSELVSPAAKVRIVVRRLEDGVREFDRTFTLVEDSDFSAPDVAWTPRQVRVSGFDNRHERSLEIPFASLDRGRVQ